MNNVELAWHRRAELVRAILETAAEISAMPKKPSLSNSTFWSPLRAKQNAREKRIAEIDQYLSRRRLPKEV